MGIYIQTNTSSINARRNLNLSSDALAKHTERISSGYRINHAADDAAGLAISEQLKSNVRAMLQAKRNTSDGISLVQTAEGGLAEISNVLVRLKELSVQSASDTVQDKERSYIQKEFGALKDEINRIAFSTEFNGTRLLTGNVNLPGAVDKNGDPTVHTTPSPLEVQVGANYVYGADAIDNPNPVHVIQIDLSKINALTKGHNALDLGEAGDDDDTRADTKAAAQVSINRVDDAIEKVNSYRASLGAIQNRLNHAVSNTGIMVENMEAAKSRIRDTDYAEETSQVVQQGILQKAGVSVLAQANALPEMALKLLG